MKKLFFYSFLLSIVLLFVLILTLSTIGIETNKFNKIISDKANKTNNINLDLKTIKFKVDLKELSLFLDTQNPKINYRDVIIPVENIKVYVDFLSVLKSDPRIKKINFVLKELDITQLNKLSSVIKPSNFTSILNNKINNGKLISEIDIFLSDKGAVENFIAKGTVKHLKANIFDDLNFSKGKLSFFADKNDILIKNIYGAVEDIKISDGDLKLNIENGIKLNSNFNSNVNLDEKLLSNYKKYLTKYNTSNNLKNLTANFNNNFSIELDNTYKIKDYNYRISGKIQKSEYRLSNPIKNSFISKEIEKIYLSDFQIQTSFAPNKISLNGTGKYSLNNEDFLKINLENTFIKDLVNLKIDFDFNEDLDLNLINYKKSKNSKGEISLHLEKKGKSFKINKFIFNDKNNSIKLSDLKFRSNEILSFKKIEVVTTNNNFQVQNNDKILIKGTKFDATNLAKFFSKQNSENIFSKIEGDIEIDFKNIKVPMSEMLQNFKLIGEIKKGKFVKISSKGDFGGNNFLDISMKRDKNSEKKYLEIYSDLTRPLLTEYSFFDGLTGGKLLFSSIIENSKSNSKLRIENFKVVNAPGMIKLLSLADLGGLADLAEGDGLSFDTLEIDMEKNKNFLKLNEILALGPSISVLMEGYQDEKGLTSLRGTLVPAKTLNKLIAKIPVIGNIVIPKEIGEGLFGISFKMKGKKGDIKTTINPIRTLTPRFIQKIIDKKEIK